MPVALDLGGNPVATGELQAAVEDYTASMAAEFDVEHDHQGRHTKPMESLEVTGLSQVLGGAAIGGSLMLEDGFSKTLTAHTNDLAEADGSAIEDVVIRLQSGSAYNLTGILPASTTRRQVHVLENGGANTITLKHNTTSTYRFSLPSSADYALESGACVLIQYDINSEIWRMVQGAPEQAVITSIQKGTIAFTNGGSNAPTATITAVDTAKAFVIYNGHISDTGGTAASCVLTNTTTVTANRDNAHNSATMTLYFTVVEYA